MSEYLTRYCAEHGEWDMDVDNVSECPKCEEENKTPYQRMRANRDELAEVLKAAKIQIIYLHEKFKETGSGNAMLAAIDEVLAKVATND